MRHIFVIFSGITRLSAIATIDRLALEPTEVVMILGRDESVLDGFECHSMRPLPMRLGRNVVRFRHQLRQFDGWMRDLARGEQLAVYLPGLFSEHLYAMATDPAVVSVNLIEEGMGSLMRQTRVYGRRAGGHSRLADLAAWGRFPQNLADCRHLLDRAFHFTPEAFPDWPEESRVLLRWPTTEPPSDYRDIDAVLSVENLIEGKEITLPEYAPVLARVVGELRRGGANYIGVKFHPGVMISNRLALTEELTRLDGVVLLPRGCTLEALMYPGGPAFVGAATSSLHYAAVAGCNAWSYVNLIESQSLADRWERTLGAFPELSQSRIRYLEM